jgi:pimeloyl-ACP methyl ester carboxylesterase
MTPMPLPTVLLPGFFAPATEYREFETLLNQRGYPTTTVPLTVKDWFPTLGGRSLTPILTLLHTTVQQVLSQTGANKVNLIGHSAGGWIARIYLGDIPYDVHPQDGPNNVWQGRSQVASLISLGTPQYSVGEKWTAKNLNFVNDNYPGAFYPDVHYVCLAGKAIYGQRLKSWLAYSSYRLTCGEGNTWGDGITPISAAHLDGAENLILEGAEHSPRRSQWYGSPDLLEQWLTHLA